MWPQLPETAHPSDANWPEQDRHGLENGTSSWWPTLAARAPAVPKWLGRDGTSHAEASWPVAEESHWPDLPHRNLEPSQNADQTVAALERRQRLDREQEGR